MSTIKWVGKESIEKIADVRMRCYGTAPAERESFVKRTNQSGFGDGDVLLLEDGGAVVGTATHLSLSMYVRGGRVPCQGVAWVGTVRSHRRRRVDGHGIASKVMNAIIAKARERGDVVTALMPFRASFYERFGYGTVERQNQWTVPLSILPAGETGGFREATASDLDAMVACRTRQAAAGQCDVDGGKNSLATWMEVWRDKGFTFVDQASSDGAITSFVTVQQAMDGDRAIAWVNEPAYDSPAALQRVLGFLATLRDQYSLARLHLPVDLPLNWLLSERQVPHRRVDHPAATCKTINRMQLRVLDHARLIDGMKLPVGHAAKVVVAVKESEGSTSTFAVEFAGDRAVASPSQASPQVTVADTAWAAVVTGSLPAKQARACRLLEGDDASVAALDRFAVGPAAFSWEYF
ncbi:hypothetical protein BH10PLA1_BH10PLA1_16090 [soil metagenome]